MNTDILMARFRLWLSWKFQATDMRNKLFTEDEYTYKTRQGEKIRQWLGPEAIRECQQQRAWDEVCRRVVRSFAMKGELAWRFDFQWRLHVQPERRDS